MAMATTSHFSNHTTINTGSHNLETLCAGAELERLTKLFLCFTSYVQHGGNAALVLIEFALNDIR